MELTESNYLFDTTVFGDYLRGRPIAQNLFSQVRTKRLNVGYSILTEAELWAGIKGLRTVNEHEIILRPFQRYFMNVTIARRGGELRATLGSTRGQSIPGIADCIIAATAEYYNLIVCSRNTRHFKLFSDFSISVVEYSL